MRGDMRGDARRTTMSEMLIVGMSGHVMRGRWSLDGRDQA